MTKPKTKYRIVCTTGERTAFGFFEFDQPENLRPLVRSLNRKFPNRNYTIEALRESEKEKIAAFVKK